MSILTIVKYGDAILKKKANEVKNIDDQVLKLLENMKDTIYAAPGIGLAAPQVAESKRIILVDLSIGEKPEQLIRLINPEVIYQEGSVIEEEGCLSLPDIDIHIERPAKIGIRALDITGKVIELEATGLLARALMHEIDHLDGILIIDRASPLKQDFYLKKIKKKMQAGEW
jgi:peptide deformylase